MDVNIGGHISCKYSMLTIWEFDQMENKHILYHGNDCLKKVLRIFKNTPEKYN